MDAKLTLRLKKKTIERGKNFARKRRTSLSKMIESYLDRLAGSEDEEITPLVKSLSGVLKGESVDFKKNYAEYLERKYK
jgi:hypothetical protein